MAERVQPPNARGLSKPLDPEAKVSRAISGEYTRGVCILLLGGAGAGELGEAPVAQGADRYAQGSARLGKRVRPAARVAAVLTAEDEASLLQATQAVGQDVGGDALGRSEELAVARLAQEQIADDEEGPAVAEHIQ